MKIKGKEIKTTSILFWFVSVIIASIMGIMINTLLGNPIGEFITNNILGKSPDIVITLNTVIRLENNEFIDLTNFNKELKNTLNEELMRVDTSNEFIQIFYQSYPLNLNKDTIINVPLISIIAPFTNPNTSEQVCAINTPIGFTAEKDKVYIVNPYIKNPYFNNAITQCTSCIENTIDVFNYGNHEATDLRIRVCTDENSYITEGSTESDDHCVRIGRERFLPSDRIGEEFTITKFGESKSTIDFYQNALPTITEWEITGRYKEGEVRSDKKWHTLTLVIGNCTLELNTEKS